MKKAYLLSLFLIVSLSGCATIGAGERGLKTSFGHVDDATLQPGLQPYNPLTEQIVHVNTQQQTVLSTDDGNSLTRNPITSDQQQISLDYSVQYRIPESKIHELYKNYKGDPFDSLVAPKVNEAMREIVAQYPAIQVTSKAGEISSRVLALTRQKMGDLIYIADVPVTHISLPSALQASILEKQQMEIQAKKKQFELEKEQKQAEITVTQARAEAEQIKLKNDALTKSPALIQYKLADVELEKAKRWNGQLPETLIVGPNQPMPFFSLKK